MKPLHIAAIPGPSLKQPVPLFTEPIRERARDLLDLWARKSWWVQLTYKPMDIRIVGTLQSLEAGNYHFRFWFGVASNVLLLNGDDICVQTRSLDVPFVCLRNADGQELFLSVVVRRQPTAEEFCIVYRQLREWIRSKTLLVVRSGDVLLSTASTCEVSELTSGLFSFADLQTGLVHTIDPSQSSSFQIKHFFRSTQVTAYTHNTNVFFSVADGDVMDVISAQRHSPEGKNALQWCVETALAKGRI